MPQAVVTHFGEASSKQASEAMYLQLYRSKVQFYRKFGGRPRVALYKALVALAYLPRLVQRLAWPVWFVPPGVRRSACSAAC